ncbi:MAG TPA: nitronate monooxygenase [Ignavibacteriales bacterium]|nr:nitronate monooxygenase [Ignavibacteriales bacterium]HOL80685.1 nitronate monooxygenase [Ignavibacteriales bacterium]HOM64373.1 nitronate monooxygenase [Ignavibacteriales bacterium]HPD67161.1 nitronate monooxygenase [Ignavibacteriales bacterium]HPP32982.1 nitronate monooxygenase [Ignavibacteriales bacterium]
MNIQNDLTKLLGIKYPIIQAGMVWVSGWKLASAVSNCGGLGLIGAGSMKPDLLREHIQKCKAATDKPFGVNLTLLREDIQDLINVCIEEKIKIVFSSAGNPAKYIDLFKKNDMTVVHVTATVKQAVKCQSVGCDAVVCEGVEAGGHNGLDELTTMVLLPQVCDAVSIPVIAAGGIMDGRSILAALSLGASGVQIGSRFAATVESSASDIYKQKLVEASDTDTILIFRGFGLIRALKNQLTLKLAEAERNGATPEQLKEMLGKKKEMAGIFNGDLENGLMEVGQGVGMIKDIPTVAELFNRFEKEFDQALGKISNFR